MGIFRFLLKKRRSFLYALTLLVGFEILLNILAESGPIAFLLSSFILSFVLLFEVSTSWTFAKQVIKQLDLPHVDESTWKSQFIHNLVMPLSLYWGVVTFLFFNEDLIERQLIILFSFFCFTVLFVNIRSFYENNFKLEHDTHYIFDVMKIVIVFFLFNCLLHLRLYWTHLFLWKISLSLTILALGGIFLVSLLFLSLVTHRFEQLGVKTFGYVLASSVLIFLFALAVVYQMPFDALSESVIIFLLYYLIASTLHHKLEGSFTWTIFGEYVLIFATSLVAMWGLT